MPSKRSTRSRRISRRRRVRLWLERAVLGGMMTLVAAVVERKLLKAIRSGGTSKKALEKAGRQRERAAATPPRGKEVGVGVGPDQAGEAPRG